MEPSRKLMGEDQGACGHLPRHQPPRTLSRGRKEGVGWGSGGAHGRREAEEGRSSQDLLSRHLVHLFTFGPSLPVGIRVWEVAMHWIQMDQNQNPRATAHWLCDLGHVT